MSAITVNQFVPYHATLAIPPKGKSRRLALVYEGVAYGGTEEYILLILRYLDRLRFSPIVVTSGFNYQFCPPQFLERLQTIGVPLVYTDNKTNTRLGSIIGDSMRLVKTFLATQTDVVHIHNQRPDGGRRATIAARLAGIRAVLRSEHLPPSSNLQFHSRYSIKPQDWLTNYIIAGSDSCLGEHFTLLNRDPKKTIRVYYGIELDRFNPKHDVIAAKHRLGLDPNIPTVGKIARLSPEKGHVYLIDAARKVIQEFGPVNFLLVGNGHLEEELRAQVANHGISEYVHFLGFAQDTVPFIEAMDITLMSSLSEGISLSMLEYMAMGKPIIATREPSFTETVIDGDSGLIVELKNASSLANGILCLLRDPQLAQRLAIAATERVHAEFDIYTNVQHLMRLYDSTLTT